MEGEYCDTEQRIQLNGIVLYYCLKINLIVTY